MSACSAFISYAHESPVQMDWVLRLANKLRQEGIEADIDQFHSFPPEGWLQWMERMIAGSDYVLVICSEQYLRRAQVVGPAGVGLGATNESQLIRLELYKEKGLNRKYIPIVQDPEHRQFVPRFLQVYTSFCPEDPAEFRKLVDLMLGREQRGATARSDLERDPGFFRKWLVPFQRNSEFCERENVIQDLNRLLSSPNTQPGAVLLHGLGGVGKTQCAIEFCYRYRMQFSSVIWLRTETLSILHDDLKGALADLSLAPQPAATLDDDWARLIGWINEKPGCLLVLDNLDDLKLPEGLLQTDNVRILATSRRRDSIPQAAKVPVASLSAESGAAMLHRLSGYSIALARIDDRERQSLFDIVNLLGNIPLALSQAGSYVRQQSITFYDFAEQLRRNEVTPQNALYECWRLNFDRLSARHARSAEALKIIAFFSPDAIPIAVLRVSFIEPRTDELVAYELIEETLQPLTDLSFVSRQFEHDTISVHRLVAETMRQYVGADAPRIRERAMGALGSVWDGIDARNMSFRGLEQQSTAMYASIKELQLRTDAAGKFMQSWLEAKSLAVFSDEPNLQFEELLNAAIEIRRRHLPAGDPNFLRLRLVASRLKQKQGQAEEAIEMLAPTLEKLEQAGGHKGMSEGYKALGEAYSSKKEYRAAIAAFNRAIGHARATNTDTFLEIGIGSSLASALLNSGDTVAADAVATEALGMAESADNPYEGSAAGPLHALAEVREAQGRIEDAAKLEFRAIELDFRALQMPIVDFALFMTERAEKLPYDANGNLNIKARVWFERAIDIAAAHVGSGSSNWKTAHPAEVELRANAGLMKIIWLMGDAQRGLTAVTRIKFLANHFAGEIKPAAFVSAVFFLSASIIEEIADNPPNSQDLADMVIPEISSAVDLLEIARKKIDEVPGDAPEQTKAKAKLRAAIDTGITQGRQLLAQLPNVKTIDRGPKGVQWLAILFFVALLIYWIFF